MNMRHKTEIPQSTSEAQSFITAQYGALGTGETSYGPTKLLKKEWELMLTANHTQLYPAQIRFWSVHIKHS